MTIALLQLVRRSMLCIMRSRGVLSACAIMSSKRIRGYDYVFTVPKYSHKSHHTGSVTWYRTIARKLEASTKPWDREKSLSLLASPPDPLMLRARFFSPYMEKERGYELSNLTSNWLIALRWWLLIYLWKILKRSCSSPDKRFLRLPLLRGSILRQQLFPDEVTWFQPAGLAELTFLVRNIAKKTLTCP